MKNLRIVGILLSAVGAWAGNCWGSANRHFTPLDLVKEANCILLVAFSRLDANTGLAVATVRSVVCGPCEANEFRFDLLAMDPGVLGMGKSVIRQIQNGDSNALLFVGTFDEGDRGIARVALLCLAGERDAGDAPRWVTIAPPRKRDVWEMVRVDEWLRMTWSGSPEALLRCVEYIHSDPNADVPCSEGVAWETRMFVRKVEGSATGATPVDIRGSNKADLFIGNERGDRLLRLEGNELRDVTASVRLASRSVRFAWCDLDGDGSMDLVSWNGRRFTLHLQTATGAFRAVESNPVPEMNDGCLGLAVVDGGTLCRAALVGSTKGWPVLMCLRPDGNVDSRWVGSGRFPYDKVGVAGKCLVEDFDGDGVPDILQLCTKAGLFYKGRARGDFAAPVIVKCRLGTSDRDGLCVGDFDGDGLLDILVTSDGGNHMWRNLGEGRFRDDLVCSGDVFQQITKANRNACLQAGDFNNDGRLDLLIAGPNAWRDSYYLFFNRGFGCFETACGMPANTDEDANNRSEMLVNAACLGDFNGDGALDMAVVTGGGTAFVFPRKVERGNNRGVVATLPLFAPTAGPVSVRAYDGKRLLGAWSVRAGEPGAIIGTPFPSTMTLRWTWPSGEGREKRVEVKDGPVRVLLCPGQE